MKSQLLSVVAIGSIISSSPVLAFSCASETLMHVSLQKNERKKIDKTLNSFFGFTDSQDPYAAKIVESWAVIDGERIDCITSWKSVEAICGPLTLTIAGGSYADKQERTIPEPLNAPYPFDYGIYNSEEYALVSRYAANDRYHQFRYNLNDPNWLAPSNAASIEQCKSWKEIKNDSSFSHLLKPMGGYFHGEIVCIEEVKCSENTATTLLSVNSSLVPKKYLPTLRSIGEKHNDNNWSSWKTYLTKVNPLLKRDDILNIKFNIVISSPMKSYSSPF